MVGCLSLEKILVPAMPFLAIRGLGLIVLLKPFLAFYLAVQIIAHN